MFGGVVEVLQGGRLKVSSSQFVANEAAYGGVLSARRAEVYVEGNETLFAMNNAKILGGVIYSSQAMLILGGKCIFRDNQAIKGGAIDAEESSLIKVYNEVPLAHDIASDRGGGLYLSHSTLRYHDERSTLSVSANRANHSGGGMHMSNSLNFVTIYIS